MRTVSKDNIRSGLKIRIAFAVILVFHCIGFVGIGVYESNVLIGLSWFNLLLSFFVGIWFFNRSVKLILALSGVFLIGMTTEAVGVNTGYLFGDYTYGQPLGIHVLGVPITIGIMWVTLAVGAKNFVTNYVENTTVRMMLAAGLMLVFDICMEPVAVHLDYWAWTAEEIPWSNYLTWFVVALAIQFFLVKINTSNKIFEWLFVIQLIFFIGLNSMI